MDTLGNVLQRRKWSDLRALAGAYHLPFSGRKTRQEESRRLAKLLLEEGHVRRQFRQFTASEREPLVALQAAGGSLPRDQFLAAFGQIRSYRPWRYDSPRQPWKQPISIAEKLWFLAFVDVNDDRVIVPAEVLDVLPPLPKVRAVATASEQAIPTAALLLVDVSILIGCLLHEDVKPIWGRWLPPRFLKRANAALRVPEYIGQVRSELQTGRLRFLHYLADVTGLIGVQMGYLRPTPAAWEWLDSPTEKQWQFLWERIQHDLESHQPLWERYRLPPISPRAWQGLALQLQALVTGREYNLISLIGALCPHLPGESLASMPELLGGALSWLGATKMNGREAFQFRGLPPTLPVPGNATLQMYGQEQNREIVLQLPAFPRLRPLVEIIAWAALDGAALLVNDEAVRCAQEEHQDVIQIAESLAQLIGEPVSNEVFTLLGQWKCLTHRLSLQHRVILTSYDSDLLTSLLADRSLRPLLEQPFSAHHLVVKPHCVDQLVRSLGRRNLPIADQRRERVQGGSDLTRVDSQTAAYLWLAVRVYQALGDFSPTPLHLPGAILDWLEGRLEDGQRDWLEQTADTLRENLARAVANEASMLLDAPVQQNDPAAIRASIERAFVDRVPVTIDYFSPVQGMITRRTIEPILPIVQRGDFSYVEAWCSEAKDERTFRLDRIIRIVST
jgi:hypothetical protein